MSPPSGSVALANLQGKLGYQFNDQQLLALALTHRSAGKCNNERLEFLGDSLVNHVVALQLYHRFPEASEGQLTRVRSRLVRGSFLAGIGRDFDLADCLVLGAGERKSGGRNKESVLADAVEAIAGAVLLDAGEQRAMNVVAAWFAEALDSLQPVDDKDSKTLLQEWQQARNAGLPRYEVVTVTGPDHQQEFEVACHADGLAQPCTGRGSNRRHAEQQAAATALAALRND